MEQLVQGFPPHIRALQALPAIPLPLLCSFSGWACGWRAALQREKGKDEERERRKRGKRINQEGCSSRRSTESGEKESGPRGWEAGGVCGGSTQVY